jgi:glycogen debranching enzyme
MEIPDLHFTSNNVAMARAVRIALGDLYGNIAPFRDGLLDRAVPVVLAGLDYDTPWTRDAAINTWNAAGLLCPEVTRSTLLAVLDRTEGAVRIGGQYWDAVIWTIGAWAQYLYSGDKQFLALALDAVRNSLAYFESTEFDEKLNLFRGAACYGDGIAAYPEPYNNTNGDSCILAWPSSNPDQRAQKGYGLPMHALSTNCLYFQAYVLAGRMAAELEVTPDPSWSSKARALKAAINGHFWVPELGRYRYLVDAFGNCDFSEGLGQSFALLFGIADAQQAQAIFANQYVAPAGIPCVWPSFSRYTNSDGMSFGRHSGTVWPHIQAFWGQAAAQFGKRDLFTHELMRLTEYANRDVYFTEIYHPITGLPYGGVQELGDEPRHVWSSCARQTWSATGYLRLILHGVLGMRFDTRGVTFEPVMPDSVEYVCLQSLPYRGMHITITVERKGDHVHTCHINGRVQSHAFINATEEGDQSVHIVLA